MKTLRMKQFIKGEDRQRVKLLPECLDDYIGEDNPVRGRRVFGDELDLQASGFEGVGPAATGRPSYHPAGLLKLYIDGYLNRIQSPSSAKSLIPLPAPARPTTPESP